VKAEKHVLLVVPMLDTISTEGAVGDPRRFAGWTFAILKGKQISIVRAEIFKKQLRALSAAVLEVLSLNRMSPTWLAMSASPPGMAIEMC